MGPVYGENTVERFKKALSEAERKGKVYFGARRAAGALLTTMSFRRSSS
jgi:hypothetical protein